MTDRWRLINGTSLYDIQADPGQRDDVGVRNPEVVRDLRQAYETWWADVSRRFDEYCEIVIGSDKENPARLTCHDWHGGESPPWDQTHVLAGQQTNGFWAVEAAQAGTYEFALRRWPREVDRPINAADATGRALPATQARLRIGEVDLTAEVPTAAKEVVFRTRLPSGRMKLQTWLTADGVSRGAYFVYLQRVGTHAG
jgi:hypothetical protein